MYVYKIYIYDIYIYIYNIDINITFFLIYTKNGE